MTFNDLNSLGSKREPFLFISDFKAQNLEVILLKDLQNEDIEFCIEELLAKKSSPHVLKKISSSL